MKYYFFVKEGENNCPIVNCLLTDCRVLGKRMSGLTNFKTKTDIQIMRKRRSLHPSPYWPIRPQLILLSIASGNYEYFYSPPPPPPPPLPPSLDRMLVHRRVPQGSKFAGTHLYTWVERDTVRVKCLARERNTRTPTVPSQGLNPNCSIWGPVHNQPFGHCISHLEQCALTCFELSARPL